jgi:hypothetical protein
MARIRVGLAATRPLACLAALLLLCSSYSLSSKATSSLDSPDRSSTEVIAWLVRRADKSTVKELIPAEYRKRYQKWKNEYLATAVGRTHWEQYALNHSFNLTITIAKQEGHGARVEGFQWDEGGRLIAATIILGNKLDSGYPSSINYPITCSLSPGNLPPEVKGKILAATKLSHEFGHLNQVMSIGRLYQLQNVLMIEYNRIFDTNGFNIHDPQLTKLVQRMGGTPVSISQDREHWAEMGAIEYLQERLPQLSKRSRLPSPIKQAIDAYYSTYPERVQSAN